jgi:ribonuclease HI
MSEVLIYADGACKGNPGTGGWGAVLKFGNREREIFGGARETTNNRMELMAVIRALEALTRPCTAAIHVDSAYVKNGITEWIHGWKRNGWRTADRKPVKNVDLWMELDRLAARHRLTWHWVKGHAGHPENERADRLANKGVEAVRDGLLN